MSTLAEQLAAAAARERAIEEQIAREEAALAAAAAAPVAPAASSSDKPAAAVVDAHEGALWYQQLALVRRQAARVRSIAQAALDAEEEDQPAASDGDSATARADAAASASLLRVDAETGLVPHYCAVCGRFALAAVVDLCAAHADAANAPAGDGLSLRADDGALCVPEGACGVRRFLAQGRLLHLRTTGQQQQGDAATYERRVVFACRGCDVPVAYALPGMPRTAAAGAAPEEWLFVLAGAVSPDPAAHAAAVSAAKRERVAALVADADKADRDALQAQRDKAAAADAAAAAGK